MGTLPQVHILQHVAPVFVLFNGHAIDNRIRQYHSADSRSTVGHERSHAHQCNVSYVVTSPALDAVAVMHSMWLYMQIHYRHFRRWDEPLLQFPQ